MGTMTDTCLDCGKRVRATCRCGVCQDCGVQCACCRVRMRRPADWTGNCAECRSLRRQLARLHAADKSPHLKPRPAGRVAELAARAARQEPLFA
jgi:hypothetical protein